MRQRRSTKATLGSAEEQQVQAHAHWAVEVGSQAQTLKENPISSRKNECSQRSRHGSLQPQENADDEECNVIEPFEILNAVATSAKSTDDTKRKPDEEDPSSLSRNLAPQLDEIENLSTATTQIKEDLISTLHMQKVDTQNLRRMRSEARRPITINEWSRRNSASLASTHCRRGMQLLEHVRYDAIATVPIKLVHTFAPMLTSTTQLDPPKNIPAVKQALDDALAALALDSRSAEAYFLAAQCSRSLGKVTNAMEFLVLAMQIDPYNQEMLQMMEELGVDIDRFQTKCAPPLLCYSPSRQLEEDWEQQPVVDDDSFDGDFQADLISRYRALEAVSSSPLLHELEQMQHHNIHHRCAHADDVDALVLVFNQTTELLSLLLHDAVMTSRAILLDTDSLMNMAREVSDARSIVEVSATRKWIVKTLAPAVIQSIPENFGSFGQENAVNANRGCRAAVLRDVLLVITRLLLATGNLQRCTLMPHALTYVKMSYDLAKQLAGEAAASSFVDSTASTSQQVKLSSSAVRLEMICADAYAVTLLRHNEEAGEALLLHQESLELAIQQKDSSREMRCHHYVGRALMQMHEYDVARAEFTDLLALSQELHDKSMECLAWYELGELLIKRKQLALGMSHLEKARVIFNQTAQCQGTWREHSVDDAIAFYSHSHPVRRRAITAFTKSTSPWLADDLPILEMLDNAGEHQLDEWDKWDADPFDQHAASNCTQPTKRVAQVSHMPPVTMMTLSTNHHEATVAPAKPHRQSLAEKVIGKYSNVADAPREPGDTAMFGPLRPKRDSRWRDSVFTCTSTNATGSSSDDLSDLTIGESTPQGPSLIGWLIGRGAAAGGGMTSPSRPECWKPFDL